MQNFKTSRPKLKMVVPRPKRWRERRERRDQTMPFPHALFFFFLWSWNFACKEGKEGRNEGVPTLPENTPKLTPCSRFSFVPHDSIKTPRKPPPTIRHGWDCWCPNTTETQCPRPYHGPGEINSRQPYKR